MLAGAGRGCVDACLCAKCVNPSSGDCQDGERVYVSHWIDGKTDYLFILSYMSVCLSVRPSR